MSGSGQSMSLRASFDGHSDQHAKRNGKRAAPVSIRFNDQDRALLKKHADGEALGPFVRRVVLAALSGKRRKAPERDSARDQAVARALRGLGRSGVYNVLSSQILAFEEGRLNLEMQQERDLRAALTSIVTIRNDLLTALGHQNLGA